MPPRASSQGGRAPASQLCSRQQASLSPPPCLASRLFSVPAPSWLLIFRLCLPGLNHNLFLHPKAPFAPSGTEAKLPHHSTSCPRPAVWESAQPTCLLPPKERNEMQSMITEGKESKQVETTTATICCFHVLGTLLITLYIISY